MCAGYDDTTRFSDLRRKNDSVSAQDDDEHDEPPRYIVHIEKTVHHVTLLSIVPVFRSTCSERVMHLETRARSVQLQRDNAINYTFCLIISLKRYDTYPASTSRQIKRSASFFRGAATPAISRAEDDWSCPTTRYLETA